jgi:tetratricopeptide (TPR) repeat protein
MKAMPWFIGVGIALFLTPFTGLGQDFDFQTELRLGADAYRKASYKEAVRHLRRAVLLNPSSTVGHLRLAETYEALYCETCEFDSLPDARTNDTWRLSAIVEYKKVLELESSNTEALNSLAHLSYRQAMPEEAARYYRKAINIDPNNAEALYTIGVTDWELSYRTRVEKQVALNFNPKTSIIEREVCSGIRELNASRIDEGLAMLGRASTILDAAEVMDYTSLLYRERAETRCGDRSAYDDDMKTSAMWARRACQARQGSEPIPLPRRWPPTPPAASDSPCSWETPQ